MRQLRLDGGVAGRPVAVHQVGEHEEAVGVAREPHRRHRTGPDGRPPVRGGCVTLKGSLGAGMASPGRRDCSPGAVLRRRRWAAGFGRGPLPGIAMPFLSRLGWRFVRWVTRKHRRNRRAGSVASKPSEMPTRPGGVATLPSKARTMLGGTRPTGVARHSPYGVVVAADDEGQGTTTDVVDAVTRHAGADFLWMHCTYDTASAIHGRQCHPRPLGVDDRRSGRSWHCRGRRAVSNRCTHTMALPRSVPLRSSATWIPDRDVWRLGVLADA